MQAVTLGRSGGPLSPWLPGLLRFRLTQNVPISGSLPQGVEAQISQAPKPLGPACTRFPPLPAWNLTLLPERLAPPLSTRIAAAGI